LKSIARQEKMKYERKDEYSIEYHDEKKRESCVNYNQKCYKNALGDAVLTSVFIFSSNILLWFRKQIFILV
jgi:hypothetical protein